MSADDFFNDGAPSATKEFGDTPGTIVGGPITEIGSETQQRDIKDGQPSFWPDGNPKMMLPITVQTDLRDTHDPTDDGKRTFWVAGNLKKAIGLALRQAGAKLALGGVLTVTFTGYGEAKQAGFNKPRLFTATYVPPAPGAAFFEAPAQATPAAPVAPQVAAPAPVPAAAAPQPTAEQIAAYQLAQQQAAAAQAAAAAQPAPQLDAQAAAYAAQMGFPAAPPA